MKRHLLLIFMVSLFLLYPSGCRSIKTKNKFDSERIEVEKKEMWRAQLPAVKETPVKPVYPKIERKILKNGLTLLVVEDHRLPIAQIGLVFKGGSARDPYGYAGLK